MRDRVDQFFDVVGDQLTSIEDRVAAFRAEILGERAATDKVIDEKLEESRAAVARIKDDTEAARTRMISQEQRKLKAGESAQWKRNRQFDKLETRAEDAEAYAAWSVMVAVGAIEEAKLAAMQAIAARLDFEQASDQ